MRSLLEAVPDAMVVAGTDGVIMMINSRFERLLGWTQSDLLGRNVDIFIPERQRPFHPHLLTGVLPDPDPGLDRPTADTFALRRDSTEFPAEIRCGLARTGGEHLITVAVRDLTERRATDAKFRRFVESSPEAVVIAALALAAAKERADTTSREYEAFSYSVAHDLRAPLRALDGFSQRLIERHAHEVDETGMEFVRRISESARYMAELIDSLLWLARLSHRDVIYEPVDLSALATAAVQQLRTQSPPRAVEVVIEPGLTARGDRRLLMLVFENLLGNAWKFSQNEPRARIEFGRVTVRGEPAYFVRDNGAGFDMAYSAKLFGIFQRLHNVGEFEGTGIGLVTVQRIVGRLGGRIWAEGRPDHGATFYFTLDPGGK